MRQISRRSLLGHLAGAAGGLPLARQVAAGKDEPILPEQELPTDRGSVRAPGGGSAEAAVLPKRASIVPVRHWVGRFVWIDGDANPYHFYLFARRNFDLSQPPSSARLHITASDRYILFVNGAYLGRGPARSDPRRKSYDTYDLTAHLKGGRNVIAVRAYEYGYTQGPPAVSGNTWTVGERAGLWAQLEMQTGSGNPQIIGTDSSWRVRPAQGWDRSVKGIACPIGCTVYDARIDPVNWTATDFDDSTWQPAWVIPDTSLEWVLLEARDIPMMEEQEIFPERLLEVGEVIDVGLPGQTDIKGLLNAEVHYPLQYAMSREAEAVLHKGGKSAEFQGKFAGVNGIRAPYLIVDFGRQVFGFPRIRLTAEEGTILDMTYGQHQQGGRMPFPFGYPMADRYTTRDGMQTWELPEYKQFRYLHLTLRSTYSPIHVESVSVNGYTYPAAQRGRFTCSDALLTALWEACIDTTYLSMEDMLVCDACRERAVFYLGDGGHGMHGVYVGYGDLPLTDHVLRFYPLSERGDDRLQILYPPENAWNHSIPNFYMQWSARVREHLLFTGRRTVLEELYPSVQRQIDWYEPHRDQMGVLRDLPGWNWVDWTPTDVRGANFATNAWYVKGLEDAAWLADQMAQPRDARRWRRTADEVRRALRLNFWNEQKGWYEDSHYAGHLTGVASELGNGCALLYDIATDDQVPRIAVHFSTGSQDLVEVSPLYFGYVADGLIKRGLVRTALDLTHARFADMLNFDSHPTIWEGWGPFTLSRNIDSDASYDHQERRLHPYGPLSLVHTGGVLIAYVLSTRVLGVEPTDPGFRNCVIYPHVGDLKWVKGTFPSPHGDIQVEWTNDGGQMAIRAEIPQGVSAEVAFDRTHNRAQTLHYDGRTYEVTPLEKSSRKPITVTPKQIRVSVEAGTHNIALEGMVY